MRFYTGLILFAASLAFAAPADDKRLVFSTFSGGDRNDDVQSIAVDRNGFVYVTGETESRDLNATPIGGKPLTSAVFKGYVAKYEPGGKKLVWRMMVGGGSNTVPHAIALDPDGNVWIGGTSGARDLPMMKPVQSEMTGLNIAFLMQLSPEGKLMFSTFFGGNRNEEGLAVACDSKGSVYLAGRASSANLPVKNAFQPKQSGGGQDAFIAKYSKDYQLEYATYLGGDAGTDNIFAIAVGPDDSLFVTGETMSPGMATQHAWIKTPQSYSSFLAKIKPNGEAIDYFTYIGFKGGYTKTQSLAVDWQGRAYVGGHTTSKQVTTTKGALQEKFAGGFRDGVLIRMNADGSDAEYITYLGGSYTGTSDPDETIAALAIDPHGHVYATGETSSRDFPGRRALQQDAGGVNDAWLMRLDLDNSEIVFSTFWGGTKKDTGLALALGPGENVTVGGEVYSADFPTLQPVQEKIGSANDGWLAQICDPWPGATATGVAFNWVRDTELPGPATVDVYSGCVQPFPTQVEIVGDAPWLTLTNDNARTVPMKLTLTAKPGAVAEPGEYKATIKITMPDSYRPVLEIPVVLTVSDPPPPPVEN